MEGSSKVAVVTGAGSGIGREVSLALCSAGYSVVLAGRHLQTLEETASLAGPGRTLAIATDVSRPDSVHALFAKVEETFHRLDVLFNNAGINLPATPTEEIAFEKWNEAIAINLTGAFLCAQQAIRIMKTQRPQGGRIINNGSISSYVPRPHSAAYTVTKHAITGLTRCLSLDGRDYHVACGQIDIGNATTQLTDASAIGALQPNGSIVPEPRFDTRYVGEAVVWMAGLPLDTNVQFMTLMATNMPFIGRG